MHKGTLASPLEHHLSCQQGTENYSRTSSVASQRDKRRLFLQLQHCCSPWKELRVWHSLIPPSGSLSVALFCHAAAPRLALPCSVCSCVLWHHGGLLLNLFSHHGGKDRCWQRGSTGSKSPQNRRIFLCSGQILTGANFSSLLPSWMLQHGTQAVTNWSNYTPCSQSPHFPPPAIDFRNTV